MSMTFRGLITGPWVVGVLLLALIVACGNPEVVSRTSTPVAPPSVSPVASQAGYKIGLLASLTGPNANRGLAAQAAAQLAANELNARGGIGGRMVQLLVENDGGDASQAVTGLKNLANQEVVAVIGPTTNIAAAAVLPVEDEASLPAISLASDQSQFEPTHSSVYGVAPVPSLVAAGLLSYLQQSKIDSIGLIRETSAYGMAGMKQLQQQAAHSGVRVIVDETYGINDTDLSRQIGNIKNNSAVEAVVVWASSRTPAPASIARQHHQLGLTVPLLLTVDQADPAFLQAAGSSANGVILEARKPAIAAYLLPDDPSRQQLAQFVAAYKQATGKDPDGYAAMAYDAFHILAGALSRAGDAPELLIAELDKTTFDGVAGPYAFSPTAHAGLRPAALAMATVRNGEIVPVQPNCDGCAETTIAKR
jgi:branched-chain amino acid transport system substrate-binding protein